MMNGEQKGSLKEKWYEVYRKLSLRQIIWFYFTITALIATMLIGFSFYGRFSSQAQDIIQEENRKLLEQVGNNCGSYIRNMMKVSDTLYYSVIKKSNLSTDSLSESFQLLYDTNKENIESISLFSLSGELLEVAPAAVLKQNAEIRKQEWFSLAMSERENLHFSTPMVSNIFSTQDAEYSWVIPLSRAVQITRGNSVQTGVLLINLRHSGLEDVFNNVLLGENAYIYLADRQGELIYHPNMQLISSGIMEENNYETATKKDGNHTEKFNGVKTDFVIKSLGYTGWKIVGVTPQSSVILGSFKSNVFVLFMACFFLTALTIIYSYISKRVSAPILSLEQSVKKLEDGNWDTDIEISGFYEVRHLGNAIKNMALQIQKLMVDIVNEHEAKRKSDLSVLQNQINPHFLYNTLDVIVWMIENEKQSEAVKAVTALARFFRISLSKGNNIITVADEIEHVRNYLTIQDMRFKNRFTYNFQIQEEALQLGTIKLVLQPLVENAIYHAMEFMDGDGVIEINVFQEQHKLKMVVKDNGCGMTEDVVKKLLDGEEFPSGRGSGVGVRNVQERIKLLFGESYGLEIFSEPDEGTEITIIIPATPYETLRKGGAN